ncbi:iron complex transport system permease protein [Scopulibacillus daqui]|uniref:Iron complex transport system permease protein n=1 Tax=Scopulibacillus daqui TaxID=1469162 RepID=A0ABS2Q2M2_9BACL|nr:iron ABC transporter permease [Scopulibacillus daqui]MBM7646180.1 iron complex transport system permease protein [Scopulibacillus daqui]
MKHNIAFRVKGMSFLINKKGLYVFSAALIILIAVIIASTALGDMNMSMIEAAKSIFGGGTSLHNLVVRSFRLPRILLAAFAGMALAVSGAILQGIVRNPLASPDIIGITGGASFTTVCFLALFNINDKGVSISIAWLPLASFAGAILSGLLVYFLAHKKSILSPFRLVLIGIGLSAGTEALTKFVMLIGPVYLASKANTWMTGSVNGASWPQVTALAIWFTVFFIITFILARRLNILELGEAVPVSLGSSSNKDKKILLIISAALTGGAVAFAGGIGFVGLMAPHMARKLVGSAYGALIPVSALIGGILVIISDTIGRTVFLPLEVPAGVLTSAIGAPYFVYLLYKSRNH